LRQYQNCKGKSYGWRFRGAVSMPGTMMTDWKWIL
jgi:hypothetical protein